MEPSFDRNGKRLDTHISWSLGAAGLSIAASPVIWFFSILCKADELHNLVVVGAWVAASIVGNLIAGWLLDRFVRNPWSTPLVMARSALAAVVVFFVTRPILDLLDVAESSC